MRSLNLPAASTVDREVGQQAPAKQAGAEISAVRAGARERVNDRPSLPTARALPRAVDATARCGTSTADALSQVEAAVSADTAAGVAVAATAHLQHEIDELNESGRRAALQINKAAKPARRRQGLMPSKPRDRNYGPAGVVADRKRRASSILDDARHRDLRMLRFLLRHGGATPTMLAAHVEDGGYLALARKDAAVGSDEVNNAKTAIARLTNTALGQLVHNPGQAEGWHQHAVYNLLDRAIDQLGPRIGAVRKSALVLRGKYDHELLKAMIVDWREQSLPVGMQMLTESEISYEENLRRHAAAVRRAECKVDDDDLGHGLHSDLWAITREGRKVLGLMPGDWSPTVMPLSSGHHNTDGARFRKPDAVVLDARNGRARAIELDLTLPGAEAVAERLIAYLTDTLHPDSPRRKAREGAGNPRAACKYDGVTSYCSPVREGVLRAAAELIRKEFPWFSVADPVTGTAGFLTIARVPYEVWRLVPQGLIEDPKHAGLGVEEPQVAADGVLRGSASCGYLPVGYRPATSAPPAAVAVPPMTVPHVTDPQRVLPAPATCAAPSPTAPLCTYSLHGTATRDELLSQQPQPVIPAGLQAPDQVSEARREMTAREALALLTNRPT